MVGAARHLRNSWFACIGWRAASAISTPRLTSPSSRDEDYSAR